MKGLDEDGTEVENGEGDEEGGEEENKGEKEKKKRKHGQKRRGGGTGTLKFFKWKGKKRERNRTKANDKFLFY